MSRIAPDRIAGVDSPRPVAADERSALTASNAHRLGMKALMARRSLLAFHLDPRPLDLDHDSPEP
jgi:hypothetical protein